MGWRGFLNQNKLRKFGRKLKNNKIVKEVIGLMRFLYDVAYKISDLLSKIS